MHKKSSKNKATKWNMKAILVGFLLFFSLALAIGIAQIPQDIRQRAQNTPGREPVPTTPPQCGATGGQPNTGVCVAMTEGCLPGEEQDEGQLDCATGQTCCSLAEVPPQCDAQSNGQTFCSTAANCTGLYNAMNIGQFDCGEGLICCKNPTFPTPTPSPTVTPEPTDAPAPTDEPEPTQTEDPTPTFGSIFVPTDEPTQAPEPEPTNPPAQNPQNPPQTPPASGTQGGLIGLILTLIALILGLFGI